MNGSENHLTDEACRHANILAEQQSLDYAPAALQSNEDAIALLEYDTKTWREKVEELHSKAERERQDVEKLESSATRRLIVRVQSRGKKEAVNERMEKEKQEFEDAVKAHKMKEQGLNVLEAELALMKDKNIDLKNKVERYNQLSAELDMLYKSVFDGRTPHYPHEDEAENALHRVEIAYTLAQAAVNKESEALNLLSQAHSCLRRCTDNLQVALGWNFSDMMGGSFSAQRLLSQALIDAKKESSRAEAFVASATRGQPQISELREIPIAKMDLFKNVVFDNIFSDLALSDQIKESMRAVAIESDHVRSAIAKGNERIRTGNERLRLASNELHTCRERLQEIRRTILLSISQGTALPPAYSPPAPGVVISEADPEQPTEALPPYMPRDPAVARARAASLLALYAQSMAQSPDMMSPSPRMMPPSALLSPSFIPPTLNGRGRSPPRRDGALTPRLFDLYDQNPYAAGLLNRSRMEDAQAVREEAEIMLQHARALQMAARRTPSPVLSF